MTYEYKEFKIEILIQATGKKYGYRISEDGIVVDQSDTGIADTKREARETAEAMCKIYTEQMDETYRKVDERIGLVS